MLPIAALPLCAQAPPDRNPLNSDLPSWLTLGIEQRVRFEDFKSIHFDPEDDDGYTLTRLLFDASVRPTKHLRFFAQGQDSRGYGLSKDKPRPGVRDTFDLRQAYVVVGDERSGAWDLKVGRQELVFGSERLLGINRWSNLPRSSDAAKLAFHRGDDRVDIFASSVVRVDPDGFDHHQDGFNLHGVYASLRSVIPHHTFEPHLLWRTRPRVVDESGRTGDSDIFTGGLRIASAHDSQWDYMLELDWQRGMYAADRLRAFMGMGQVGYTFARPWSPRLMAEYTFASGDEGRGDGEIGTFDQIQTRAHRIWGIADQVGGRNSKILQTGLHFRPFGPLEIKLDHYAYWLANRNDALYRNNGSLWVPAVPGGAQETFVGNEIDLYGTLAVTPFLGFGGGVGHMFPGGFLDRYTAGGSPQIAYVFATFKM